jgi:hypothetical protein
MQNLEPGQYDYPLLRGMEKRNKNQNREKQDTESKTRAKSQEVRLFDCCFFSLTPVLES